MRLPLALFLVVACARLAPIAAAEPTAADAPNPGTAVDAPVAPEIEEAFRSALTAPQAERLSGSGIESLAAALTPEQKALVRGKLSALEAGAPSAAALGEIQRAYLLLGSLGDALRVAVRATRASPGKASGYVLQAEALAEMGRYEEAAAQAREGLRLDPQDRSALTLLKMNEGRVSRNAGPVPAWSATASGKARPGESKFTYQLRQHFRAADVPPLTSSQKPWSSPELPFSAGAILLGAGLGAVLAKGRLQARSLLAGAVACAGLGAGGFAYQHFAASGRSATDVGMYGGELAPLLAGRPCPKGMTATAALDPIQGAPGRTGQADPRQAAEISRCESLERGQGRDGSACRRGRMMGEGGVSSGGQLNPPPSRGTAEYRCVPDGTGAAALPRTDRSLADSDSPNDRDPDEAAGSEGGLHLYKSEESTTHHSDGWKEGDHMLYLKDQGSPQKNWIQNSRRLREAMKQGKPIYDSYRDSTTGLRVEADGFLQAERHFLAVRGWSYDFATGAYYPPKPLGPIR